MKKSLLSSMPLDLGDDLLLRWGRPGDADALAKFNVRMHSDDPQQPELWLGHWTRDLLSGVHPTTSPADFTVVEDLRSGAIISSLVSISQTWLYEDIPFKVGRPELIATEEAYRRRGLVRRQMEVIHELSAQKGEIAQAITGIPWYYRQFGYEMAVNLEGGYEFFWARPGNDKAVAEERYQMRPAVEADIAVLRTLYSRHTADSLLALDRSDEYWRYNLLIAHKDSPSSLKAHLVADETGKIVAYVVFHHSGTAFFVTEIGVAAGHSWRGVALFITRELKRRADKLNEDRQKPITNISFPLDHTHPVIQSMGRQLEKRRDPYSWFIRVPDLPRFLVHIAPVLERRLARSVVAGYSGSLRLNFYRDALSLHFEEGALCAVDSYRPEDYADGDALFPDLTFLQLLFGHRALEELELAFTDCYPLNAGAAVLLDALFPRRPSWISPLD